MKGNVTCSCGHSWNTSDSSKEDMNVCHICGKDNTMKDGGWLDKYQEGGNVAVSDATRTKFTKNTGLKKGVDQPVSNMLDITLSAPQRQLVKMITGKEQFPSEAIGIENPYGAFAVDAILDPTNLVGAGLVGKAAKASTKTGVLSKAYKINPFAFKPNPEAYYRMLGKEGYDDALKSGKLGPKKDGYFNEAYYSKGYPLDKVVYPKVAKEKGLYKNASIYEGPYMAEVKEQKELFSNPSFTASYSGPDIDFPVSTSINDIPLNNPNVNIYKQHWLKGYKEVPNPL